jgi:hypothetical protein
MEGTSVGDYRLIPNRFKRGRDCLAHEQTSIGRVTVVEVDFRSANRFPLTRWQGLCRPPIHRLRHYERFPEDGRNAIAMERLCPAETLADRRGRRERCYRQFSHHYACSRSDVASYLESPPDAHAVTITSMTRACIGNITCAELILNPKP